MTWMMRRTYRPTARMDGKPVILLTTKGARTGETRTTPVMSFAESDSAWLVVASYAGAARHPAWFTNMASNPSDVWIELEGRRLKVIPASLEGEDRAKAWERITSESPRFTGYEKKTDREIPVVRLTAAPS
jgi:deazaflavin-dependent oxidoreductase (nitroreductase family)